MGKSCLLLLCHHLLSIACLTTTVLALLWLQVRYDRAVGSATRVKFMTDGILLRELQEDFLLRRWVGSAPSVVMCSEFGPHGVSGRQRDQSVESYSAWLAGHDNPALKYEGDMSSVGYTCCSHFFPWPSITHCSLPIACDLLWKVPTSTRIHHTLLTPVALSFCYLPLHMSPLPNTPRHQHTASPVILRPLPRRCSLPCSCRSPP